jgi:hypothetical protein
MVLRRTTTKNQNHYRAPKKETRNTACKRLALQMSKQTLTKVEEAKQRRRTPHQRKRMPSSAPNMDTLQHGKTRPSPKRAPAPSPRFEGAVPSEDGTLTLELEL